MVIQNSRGQEACTELQGVKKVSDGERMEIPQEEHQLRVP